MTTRSPSITCTSLSFSWPDGTPVFDDLSAAFPARRTGLVGVNGSGKSTLLRMIAGDLRPTDGTVVVSGDVGYLPQTVTLDTGRRVDEVLGIATVRNALRAIETGDVDERHFDAVSTEPCTRRGWPRPQRQSGTTMRSAWTFRTRRCRPAGPCSLSAISSCPTESASAESSRSGARSGWR